MNAIADPISHHHLNKTPPSAGAEKAEHHREKAETNTRKREGTEEPVKRPVVDLAEKDNKLEYEYDRELDHMIAQIKDAETDEVIREIPSRKLLSIASRIEKLFGLKVNLLL